MTCNGVVVRQDPIRFLYIGSRFWMSGDLGREAPFDSRTDSAFAEAWRAAKKTPREVSRGAPPVW